MSVYLVTWDINKENTNYSDVRVNLLAKIATYESKKDPGLDSVVFISSTKSPNYLCNDLRSVLDNNDRLVVTKININEYAWLLSKVVADWIRARI